MDRPVPRQRAELGGALGDTYEVELGEVVQINKMFRPRQPHVHHRHQALAAGKGRTPSPSSARSASASPRHCSR
jgi:hypothetical protein